MEHDAIINCLIAVMFAFGGLGWLFNSSEDSGNYLVIIKVAFGLMVARLVLQFLHSCGL